MNTKIANKYLGGSTAGNVQRRFANVIGGGGGAVPAKVGGRVWQNASAAPTAQSGMIPTSAPYILQISNGSNGSISNFDVFGAFQYWNTGVGTWSGGTWTYQNVNVSSVLSGTSYQQLLGQSFNKPFTIAQTMLQVISNTPGQLTQPVQYSVTMQNGKTYGEPIIFVYNQFQQITTQVTNYTTFTIDGNAKLTFSSLLPSVVFQVFIYPVLEIDVTNSLANTNVISTYGNPGTNSQTVQIGG